MTSSPNESFYPMGKRYNISFSGKYRDAIFGDDLLENPNHDRFAYIDNVQEYKLNSSGYRGPEFAGGTDLLFSGCSFTYGAGIPEDGIWGSILANQTNMSYNNLSLSGASIGWMVRQMFAYFKKYGNPKVLLCLFPNPTKLFFAADADILISDDGYVETSTQDDYGKKSLYSTTLHEVIKPIDRPEYSRRPHNINDVVSLDSVIQMCMQNIRSLEQYCRATGIKFLWSTWSKDFSGMIESQGMRELYDFSHYISINNNLWSRRDGSLANDLFYDSIELRDYCTNNHVGQECNCFIECHDEFKDRYADTFYKGTDDFYDYPHFGVHRHIHMAEAFMRGLDNENDIFS